MGKPTGFLEFTRALPQKRGVQDRKQDYREFVQPYSEKELNELVIAEVKQEQPFYHSAFRKLMLEERIFPTSISKYCMGTVLTHPGIKYNRFKPKLIILNKICNGAARNDLS